MCYNIKNNDSIVGSWDGVLKWFGDSIQFPIRNTHPPDDVVDVGDILLVWFSCDYNKRNPWYFTLFDPFVREKFLDLLHNDI